MSTDKHPAPDVRAKARVEGDIIENRAFAWTLWTASVIVNACGIYLWLIFGRMGSSVSASEFHGVTAVGVAFTVATSVLALVLKRPALGLLLVWATLPIIVMLLIAISRGA